MARYSTLTFAQVTDLYWYLDSTFRYPPQVRRFPERIRRAVVVFFRNVPHHGTPGVRHG